MGQRFRTLILLLALSGVAILVGTFLSGWGREPGDVAPPSIIPGTTGRVKVEVLNGGGVPGVAWEATRALRDKGFDVVLYDNAGTYSEDPSVVMDRVGDLETARSVANALGIARVITDPDSTRYVDVSVLLGAEWTGSGTGPVDEEDEDPAPWWDLRRIFNKNDTGESPIE